MMLSDNIKKKHKKIQTSQLQLQSMVFPGLLCLFVFAYIPMFGIVLAFKDGDVELNIMKTIMVGDWVGFANFKSFLTDKNFLNIMLNTVGLNLLMLLINFPAPIIFALLMNEIKQRRFKRVIQAVTYLPHFLSWVVFGGIVLSILNMETGVINDIFVAIGIFKEPINIIGQSQYFWAITIITQLIKSVGWGSIVYLAAISGIDPTLYEAADLDGASRWQKIRYITLPSISQTIILFLLLNISSLLSNGTDQLLVLQNTLNLSRSEVIDTYVLKYGIRNYMYSFATAVGVFKSVVGIILLLGSNFLSKKITGKTII